MKNNIWNVILYERDGEKLKKPKNNPNKSKKYLCTCINFLEGKEVARYLQLMFYDAENKRWHDCGNPSGLSHIILAWTDNVPICDCNDYVYETGGILCKK